MPGSRNDVALGSLAVVAALALCGCAHFHAQPMSAEQSGAAFDGRTLTDADLRGFLEFNGVSGEWPRSAWDLETLTLAAFYYQPSLDFARAEWGTATAGVITAGERPNPALSISPFYNTTTTIPSPWIVTPSLDIPIETAGKRRHRVSQATEMSTAARLKIASMAWQVRSAVRRTLVDLHAAEERKALLKEQQKIQVENLRVLEAQFQAGDISAFELTQARVAADDTRLAWHDAQRQALEARVQLAEAIGIPAHALDGVNLSFASLKAVATAVDLADARRQALSKRADILTALAQYAASESALQLEIAKQYPDIHLSTGYEFDQGDNKWSLGLSITLPLLNRNQGPIAEAEARRAAAAATFDVLQAKVLADIDRAAAGYQAALAQEADADAILDGLQSQKHSARGMFDAGEISRSELAGMQLQFFAAAIARADALHQARQAKGRLEDALQSPAELLPADPLGLSLDPRPGQVPTNP